MKLVLLVCSWLVVTALPVEVLQKEMQHCHQSSVSSVLSDHSGMAISSRLWSVYNCDCGITTGCRCADPMWDLPCADCFQEEEGMDDQGYRQNA